MTDLPNTLSQNTAPSTEQHSLPNETQDAQAYEKQLQHKIQGFRDKLSDFYDKPIDVFDSPKSGYRMRAEFRIWHEEDDTHYVMHHTQTKKTYQVHHFAPAHPAIQEIMPVLRNHIERSEVLRRKLFSAEFLVSSQGEMIITLIYHKPVDELWEEEAETLSKALNVYVIGRSRKKKHVIGQDFVTEMLTINNQNYLYRQHEGAFSQPNWHVNTHMVTWAVNQAKPMQGDLLELYCGNGNFTLPLSKEFKRVFTTEINKTSVRALQWGLEENQIENVDCARLSAEECTQALDGVRPFRRLAHIDLHAFNLTTVFVDPPRAGLDSASLAFISRFENIIYISCNPTTLAENLAHLTDSHDVVSAAAFDQFPFTPHLEAGVVLMKRL